MTALAKVALEFCKSCLGWEEADTFTIGRKQRVVRNLSATSGAGDIFNATDLNAVMEAVRKWRDQTQEALDEYVTVTLSCASGEYIGHAFVGTATPTTASSTNPCHALLAACVEASRKLKAT